MPTYGPIASPVVPGGAVEIAAGTSIQPVIDAHGAGTAYYLRAGTYRQQTITPKSGDTFVGEYGAILNGSELLPAWTTEGSNYAASVTGFTGAGYGDCIGSETGCMYADDVYYDSLPLARVMSLGALGPGKFFHDLGANKIYIRDTPVGHVVERAKTPVVVAGSASGVTFRNLVVEKYASEAQAAALPLGPGWVAQYCSVQLNHGIGLRVSNSVNIANCRMNWNGQMGVGGSGTNYTVDECEVAYNNYARFAPEWEAGGSKFTYSDTFEVTDSWFHHNAGPGLWLDIENINYTLDGNTSEYNYSPNASPSPGIMVEISWGGQISNNTCTCNGQGFDAWLWGAGILISSSGGAGIDIYGNTCAHNLHGIALIQQNRSADGPGRYVQNVHVHDNTITMAGSALTGAVQDVGDNAIFTSRGNTFENNTYHLTAGAHFAWDNLPLDDAGWQSYGNDDAGTFTYDAVATDCDLGDFVPPEEPSGGGGGGGGGFSFPEGTLVVSGWGQSAGFKFLSPTGTDLGEPASAPTAGSGSGITGFMALKPSGHIATLGAGTTFPTTSDGLWNASDFTVRAEMTDSAHSLGWGMAVDGNDKWYSVTDVKSYVGGDGINSIVTIFKYDEDGNFVQEWNFTTGPLNALFGMDAKTIAVNSAGTKAYILGRDPGFTSGHVFPPKVYEADLAGAGTWNGVFIDDGQPYTTRISDAPILALSNGDLLVSWWVQDGPGYIKRYNSAGVEQQTYTYGANEFDFDPIALAYGLTDATFWVTAYGDLTTYSAVRLIEFDIDTGAVLHAFAPEDGEFQFDSVMTVLRVGIGEIPVTTTTPPPTLPGGEACCGTPSDPTVPISNTPPPIGPAWTRSCVGGGTVPTAADIVGAEVWDY